MNNFNKNYLEDRVCPCCGNIEVVFNGGDSYTCSVCGFEGGLYDKVDDLEELLKDKVCPECGAMAASLELLEDDEDYDYVCNNCGHQGNIQDELDAQNYFWDEALCGYDEGDKGEVFDRES